MKKSLYILYIMCLVVLSGCQVIGEDDRYIRLEGSKTDRVNLLVEYTGWRCPNCPKAANAAHELLEANDGNLVVVELHPALNGLTRPDRGGRDNYQCPEADVYYQYMGGTNVTPFPTGVLNFEKQPSGVFFTDYSAWGKAVHDGCLVVPEVKVADVNAVMDSETRELVVYVSIEGESETLHEVECVVWLIEDDIIGQQIMPDGHTEAAYSHNHVLRQVIGEVWGETVQVKKDEPTICMQYGQVLDQVEEENAYAVVLLMKDKRVLNCNIGTLIITE